MPASLFHNVKFIFHPVVIQGLTHEEIVRRCKGILEHTNFILRKNTIRELVFKEYIVSEIRTYTNSYFDLQLGSFDIWIHCQKTDSDYSKDASTGSDISGVGVIFQKWLKLYDPNSVEYDYLQRQVGAMVHEFGHHFIMPGELYDMAVQKDFSGTEPNLSIDIRLNPPEKVTWWKDHLDCYYDPMFNYKGAEVAKFGRVNAASINGNYHSPKYFPKIPDISKIFVNTLPNSKVVVWRNDQQTEIASVIAEGNSDNSGLFTFNWGVANWTLLSNKTDRVRYVKVYKDGIKPFGIVIDLMDLLETTVIKNSNFHVSDIFPENDVPPIEPPPEPPIEPPTEPEKPTDPAPPPPSLPPVDYTELNKIQTELNNSYNKALNKINELNEATSVAKSELDAIVSRIRKYLTSL